MTALPIDASAKAAIREAVAANFDQEIATLADFVRIPSRRFEEGPAQDFMADALAAMAAAVPVEAQTLRVVKHSSLRVLDLRIDSQGVCAHRPQRA